MSFLNPQTGLAVVLAIVVAVANEDRGVPYSGILVGALVEVPGWPNAERLKWIEYNVYVLIAAQFASAFLLTLRGRS